jgi:hypothetical protein
MSVKINSLQMENVKKVSALAFEPGECGLTLIGGPNGAGKTSVLDAICFALGGEKYRPSNLQRDGSYAPAYIKLTLSNGLVVERAGKNATLKVTDPTGQKAGQKLLDSFVETFALDLPNFMEADSKKKAEALLKTLGIGDVLNRLDRDEKIAYDERTALGRIADSKKKFAAELPHFPDAPESPVSAGELIQRQQAILLKNAENQKLRGQVESIETEIKATEAKKAYSDNLISDLYEKLKREQANGQELADRIGRLNADLATACRTAEELQDESTEEIESSLRDIDEINSKVRANMDKAKAIADADAAQGQTAELTAKIESIRQARTDLLSDAAMPLPGLTIEQGELLLNGKKWDCMSGSEQLRASCAIVRAIRPECGFVLMDKLEQMDPKTLTEFGHWAEGQELQIIATRVSTGDECQIIIEDGNAVQGGIEIAKFSAGEF